MLNSKGLSWIEWVAAVVWSSHGKASTVDKDELLKNTLPKLHQEWNKGTNPSIAYELRGRIGNV